MTLHCKHERTANSAAQTQLHSWQKLAAKFLSVIMFNRQRPHPVPAAPSVGVVEGAPWGILMSTVPYYVTPISENKARTFQN
jgi:hypothetical protein